MHVLIPSTLTGWLCFSMLLQLCLQRRNLRTLFCCKLLLRRQLCRLVSNDLLLQDLLLFV